MPNHQTDLIKKEFIKYLDSLGLSPLSHKNYRSDLGYFISWAILKVRSFGAHVESLTEVIPFLSGGFGQEFRNYMAQNSVPAKTINRRLSTLRHLARFLVGSHTVDEDFASGIENVSTNPSRKPAANPVFNNFKSYLENEKASPITIKNYLSDIRHFLAWLESTNQQSNKLTN
jgi:site-specific recombinase XerD